MSEPTLLSQPTVIGGSLELKESDGTLASTATEVTTKDGWASVGTGGIDTSVPIPICLEHVNIRMQ